MFKRHIIGGCRHHHERHQRQQSLKDNQDGNRCHRRRSDKCDIAYCYARTLGPLGPSATDIDRFRHCLESVSAEDRDAAARYVEETYAADLLTLEDLEGVLNVVETSARYKATGEF